MYRGKKILALIPARGGSKGILRKNIRPFLGSPLIVWTIEQAKKSSYIDRIIVSTDDRDIASICERYRVKVPFLRPKRLSTDKAKSIDVLLHAVDWLKKKDDNYDIILMLQPTSPLRLSQDIDRAIRLLFSKAAKAIVSVCAAEKYLHWSNRLPRDRCMKDFISPKFENKNRQALPQRYRINGAIYLGSCSFLTGRKGFYGTKTFAYIMPKERSVDIDDDADFLYSEFLMKRMLNRNFCRRRK